MPIRRLPVITALALPALLACCAHSPPPPLPAPTSMHEAIAQARLFVRERRGSAPCTVDEPARCEAACARSGWACTSAAEARYSKGDLSGAVPLYVSACNLRDPAGCIATATLSFGRDDVGALVGDRLSLGSFALAVASCELIERQPHGIPTTGPAGTTSYADACAPLTFQFANRIPERLDDSMCHAYRDDAACKRDRRAHDAAWAAQVAEREQAQREGKEQEEAAFAARKRQAEDARQAARLDEYEAQQEARRRAAASQPASAAPKKPRGYLSRGECHNLFIEICHKLEIKARRRGITDRNALQDITAKCITDFDSAITDKCVASPCGESWRHCVEYKAGSAEEVEECTRSADSCLTE